MALPGLDLRDGVQGLVRLAEHDLSTLWRQVRNAAEAEVALRDILPGLIDAYGAAAGTLAADWYDDLRDKVGVAGAFRAIPAEVADTGTQALIGWAATTAGKQVNPEDVMPTMQVLVLGGTQRRVANFSRLTVAGSSVADPQARGWQRVGSGECDFCSILLGRGAVYSEASADFASHDHCRCSAVPAWGGMPIPVKPYTPSSRNISDADRARVREWIASH